MSRSNEKKIPLQIRRMMEVRGINSIKELAQRSGVHVSRLYYGFTRFRFTPTVADRVAKALGCDPELLGEIVSESRKYLREHSICWECVNAVPDAVKGHGCNWSKGLVPIDGWEAEKHRNKEGQWSYRVVKCPEFKEG